jgi:hypothetical protein
MSYCPKLMRTTKLKSGSRILFQAKETREGGEPTSAEIGPSIDFYLKHWIKLEDAAAFDLDDAKGRPAVFSIGYRYLPSPDAPAKNRLEPLVTLNFSLRGKVLFSDRNRADLDWQSGKSTWEYRNRVQLERTMTIRSYHLSPYASAEFFYTRANTRSGATLRSMPAACCPPANMWSSTLTTSIRTIPASDRINS